MKKPSGWLRFMIVLVAAVALASAGDSLAEKKKKKVPMVGIEALKMSDSELFPDLNPPPKKWKAPGGYMASAKNGEKVFSNKKSGNCAACHCAAGVKGCGDIGPSLDKYMSDLGDGKSKEWIYQQIADARVHNPDTAMPPTLTTKSLTEQEVVDVVAYIMTFK